MLYASGAGSDKARECRCPRSDVIVCLLMVLALKDFNGKLNSMCPGRSSRNGGRIGYNKAEIMDHPIRDHATRKASQPKRIVTA